MFKFYFQTGEFLKDNFDIWKDFLIPLLGVGIPLWIFYEGTKKQNKIERLKKEEHYKEKIYYFDNLFRKAIEFGLHLEDSINQVLKELNEAAWNTINFEIASSDDLRRLIFDIDQEDFYHAYRSIFKDNKISIIFNGLDTLNDIRNSIVEQWTRGTKKIRKRKNSITKINGKVITEVYKVPIKSDEDQKILNQVEEVFMEYLPKYGIEQKDYNIVLNSYIKPLQSILINLPKRKRSEWNAVINELQKSEITIYQIISIGKSLNNNLSAIVKVLKDVNDSMAKTYIPLYDYIEDLKKHDKY